MGVYKGRNIYWIPVYTAKMYMRAYPDYFGTYHPGDNFKITLRTETGHETTFVVFTVKTLHIEYDFMEDCVIRKSSWSIVNSIFSGEKNDFVRDPNKDTYIRLYYGSLNYLFPDDTIKEDISFPNRLNLSLYQAWNDTVRERILYTYRNYGYYNNSDTLYPVYVVSVDSVEDDPDGYAKPAGSTYWPWLDQNNPHPEDSLNMVSVIYIKWCENYCEYRGLDLSLYVGSVIAHELGHFICYLRDANFYTWEHTGPCIMNYDTLMTWVEDGKLPYFCSKCIYYLRKNPRSRGPVVFRRRQP
ncbi:hypothetical protein DRQ20_02590 [bacterium]|nr:MAG: hypothetical protein DRQ20_02590 [bacterium]